MYGYITRFDIDCLDAVALHCGCCSLVLRQDEVETHVTDHSEPVDVRKNRALTLENLKLSREVERLREFQGDNDLMKKEIKTFKSKLEEERKGQRFSQTWSSIRVG